eukprot:Gregarina_sp_Poly_1__8553@NODE_506_length_7859_cov_36_845996_g404_i0_p1_GENE_NODE_506_length_7859_cov_36_845996_g404_i0NODE_506_length_7859_cov_36_845996_g404_i0_p1_ORF_typecomplete_len2334_score376_72DUF3713/PF12506_8/1_3e04DUF3713/PF12506_8/0_44_NODE_506_length_7859_cov_36_845996_g404_i03417003
MSKAIRLFITTCKAGHLEGELIACITNVLEALLVVNEESVIQTDPSRIVQQSTSSSSQNLSILPHKTLEQCLYAYHNDKYFQRKIFSDLAFYCVDFTDPTKSQNFSDDENGYRGRIISIMARWLQKGFATKCVTEAMLLMERMRDFSKVRDNLFSRQSAYEISLCRIGSTLRADGNTQMNLLSRLSSQCRTDIADRHFSFLNSSLSQLIEITMAITLAFHFQDDSFFKSLFSLIPNLIVFNNLDREISLRSGEPENGISATEFDLFVEQEKFEREISRNKRSREGLQEISPLVALIIACALSLTIEKFKIPKEQIVSLDKLSSSDWRCFQRQETFSFFEKNGTEVLPARTIKDCVSMEMEAGKIVLFLVCGLFRGSNDFLSSGDSWRTDEAFLLGVSKWNSFSQLRGLVVKCQYPVTPCNQLTLETLCRFFLCLKGNSRSPRICPRLSTVTATELAAAASSLTSAILLLDALCRRLPKFCTRCVDLFDVFVEELSQTETFDIDSQSGHSTSDFILRAQDFDPSANLESAFRAVDQDLFVALVALSHWGATLMTFVDSVDLRQRVATCLLDSTTSRLAHYCHSMFSSLLSLLLRDSDNSGAAELGTWLYHNALRTKPTIVAALWDSLLRCVAADRQREAVSTASSPGGSTSGVVPNISIRDDALVRHWDSLDYLAKQRSLLATLHLTSEELLLLSFGLLRMDSAALTHKLGYTHLIRHLKVDDPPPRAEMHSMDDPTQLLKRLVITDPLSEDDNATPDIGMSQQEQDSLDWIIQLVSLKVSAMNILSTSMERFCEDKISRNFLVDRLTKSLIYLRSDLWLLSNVNFLNSSLDTQKHRGLCQMYINETRSNFILSLLTVVQKLLANISSNGDTEVSLDLWTSFIKFAEAEIIPWILRRSESSLNITDIKVATILFDVGNLLLMIPIQGERDHIKLGISRLAEEVPFAGRFASDQLKLNRVSVSVFLMSRMMSDSSLWMECLIKYARLASQKLEMASDSGNCVTDFGDEPRPIFQKCVDSLVNVIYFLCTHEDVFQQLWRRWTLTTDFNFRLSESLNDKTAVTEITPGLRPFSSVLVLPVCDYMWSEWGDSSAPPLLILLLRQLSATPESSYSVSFLLEIYFEVSRRYPAETMQALLDNPRDVPCLQTAITRLLTLEQLQSTLYADCQQRYAPKITSSCPHVAAQQNAATQPLVPRVSVSPLRRQPQSAFYLRSLWVQLASEAFVPLELQGVPHLESSRQSFELLTEILKVKNFNLVYTRSTLDRPFLQFVQASTPPKSPAPPTSLESLETRRACDHPCRVPVQLAPPPLQPLVMPSWSLSPRKRILEFLLDNLLRGVSSSSAQILVGLEPVRLSFSDIEFHHPDSDISIVKCNELKPSLRLLRSLFQLATLDVPEIASSLMASPSFGASVVDSVLCPLIEECCLACNILRNLFNSKSIRKILWKVLILNQDQPETILLNAQEKILSLRQSTGPWDCDVWRLLLSWQISFHELWTAQFDSRLKELEAMTDCGRCHGARERVLDAQRKQEPTKLPALGEATPEQRQLAETSRLPNSDWVQQMDVSPELRLKFHRLIDLGRHLIGMKKAPDLLQRLQRFVRVVADDLAAVVKEGQAKAEHATGLTLEETLLGYLKQTFYSMMLTASALILEHSRRTAAFTKSSAKYLSQFSESVLANVDTFESDCLSTESFRQQDPTALESLSFAQTAVLWSGNHLLFLQHVWRLLDMLMAARTDSQKPLFIDDATPLSRSQIMNTLKTSLSLSQILKRYESRNEWAGFHKVLRMILLMSDTLALTLIDIDKELILQEVCVDSRIQPAEGYELVESYQHLPSAVLSLLDTDYELPPQLLNWASLSLLDTSVRLDNGTVVMLPSRILFGFLLFSDVVTFAFHGSKERIHQRQLGGGRFAEDALQVVGVACDQLAQMNRGETASSHRHPSHEALQSAEFSKPLETRCRLLGFKIVCELLKSGSVSWQAARPLMERHFSWNSLTSPGWWTLQTNPNKQIWPSSHHLSKPPPSSNLIKDMRFYITKLIVLKEIMCGLLLGENAVHFGSSRMISYDTILSDPSPSKYWCMLSQTKWFGSIEFVLWRVLRDLATNRLAQLEQEVQAATRQHTEKLKLVDNRSSQQEGNEILLENDLAKQWKSLENVLLEANAQEDGVSDSRPDAKARPSPLPGRGELECSELPEVLMFHKCLLVLSSVRSVYGTLIFHSLGSRSLYDETNN